MDKTSTWESDAHTRRALQDYERLLAPSRERFALSPGIQALQASQDEAFLESFLLHFCALGSWMTEILERLGVQRAHTVEIGRWVVHPRYRANGRTGTNLAAAAAALALRNL
jgi:hypothetical protein